MPGLRTWTVMFSTMMEQVTRPFCHGQQPSLSGGSMDILQFVDGCTFDDFLLKPQHGVLQRRDPDTVDLSARFSEHLTLKRPLVSANMDTVTRAAMAAVLAEEGGIGVIDRGFRTGDIAPQVAEIAAVKRTQHGIIADPHTVRDGCTVSEGVRRMEETGVG